MNQELKSKTLSASVSDPKKSSFIKKHQIILNYCDIIVIDIIPDKFKNLTKLFLSHNKIVSLTGVEQFKNLNQLSIGYNLIDDWQEILKISNPNTLKFLSVLGNPFEIHPDYKYHLIEHFKNLEKLEDQKIDNKFRLTIEKSSKILQMNLITFFYFLNFELNDLQNLLSKLKLFKQIKNDEIKEYDSHENFLEKLKHLTNISRYEWLNSYFKQNDFNNKEIIPLIKMLSTIVISMYGSFENMEINERQIIFSTYKNLFCDILDNYRKKNDKNLEFFLVSKALSNEFIDPEKFAEDDDYSFQCLLYEFFRMLPTQAHLHTVTCFDTKNNLLSPSKEYFSVTNNPLMNKKFCNLTSDNLSSRIYKYENGKLFWNYKKNEIVNELEIDNRNPENLKNELLIHFPIFSCNKNYLQAIADCLNEKLIRYLSLYNEAIKILNNSKLIIISPTNLKQNIITFPINNTNKIEIEEKGDQDKSLKRKNQQTSTYFSKKSDKSNETNKSLNNENDNFIINNAKTFKQSNKVIQINKNSQFNQTKKIDNFTNTCPLRIIDEKKIKILKKNFCDVLNKILQKKIYDYFKNSLLLIKEKAHKFSIYKGISLFENFFNRIKEKLNFFDKKKFFFITKKNLKYFRSKNIQQKMNKRKIFDLIYENYLKKLKNYKIARNLGLKYKIFLGLLKIVKNRREKKKLLQRFLSANKKKIKNSIFHFWKNAKLMKKNQKIDLKEYEEFLKDSQNKTNQIMDEKEIKKKRERINLCCCNKSYFRKCVACQI